MKSFKFLPLILVFILVFSSISAAQTPEITIWCSEKQVDILQKLGEEFKAEYGVSVNVQYVEFGSIKPNFLTAAPQGKGADIIVGAHDWVGELVINGLLEPVPPFEGQETFYSTALDAFSYGGNLYGLPYSMEAIALIYNKEYVEEPPKNMEELINIAKRIDATYKGEVRGFITSAAEFYYAAPFILGSGGYVFKETPEGLDVTDIGLASPGAIKGAELWKRLVYKDAGIDYGVALIPDLEEGLPAKPFVGVQGFMINAKSPNKVLARDFLVNFIATKDTMHKIYLADPRLPSREDVLSLVEDDPDIVGFTQSAANGTPMPNVMEMAAVWGAMNDALNLIINGKASPEDALINAVETIKAQIGK